MNEVGGQSVGWIHLGQNMDQQLDLAIVAVNLRFYQNTCNFLTS
jgi:hypothetical protein